MTRQVMVDLLPFCNLPAHGVETVLMKRNQIVLGILFLVLPVVVIAVLTKEASAKNTSCAKTNYPVWTTSCGTGSQTDIREYHGLSYYQGEGTDSLKHKLNLFIPEGTENPPLLIWIHGGAWAFGDRDAENPLARKFAESGIAVAAVSYRLSPATWRNHNKTTGVQHPEHIRDIARAFSWLREKAGEYGYNSNALFVGGYSAGAQLTALLSLDPQYLDAHGLSPAHISGAIPIAGAYDIPAYYNSHVENNGRELADKHVKVVFGHTPEELENASPTTYLSNKWVPMLVISEQETLDYTRIFENKAKAHGNDHIQFLHVGDQDHAGLYEELSNPDSEIRENILRFITSHSPDYNYLQIEDGILAYKVHGSGEPLFLLNGGPGYASHHFRDLAKQLSEKYTVVIFDQRGTGYSTLRETTEVTVNLHKMVADLENLRKHLGYDRVNLLGHSFGGMYASLYAAAYPQHVSKMILSHSGGLDMRFTENFQSRLTSRLLPEERTLLATSPYPPQNIGQRLTRLKAIAPAYVADRSHVPSVYDGLAFKGRFNRDVNRLVYADLNRSSYNLVGEMRAFKSPVLIIHGKEDLVDPEIAIFSQSVFPNSELLMLDSGHYSFIEQPQAYFNAIHSFLLS